MAYIVSIILVAVITSSLSVGFGIRKCELGLYKDGANCLSCKKTLGDLCIQCSGPDICD